MVAIPVQRVCRDSTAINFYIAEVRLFYFSLPEAINPVFLRDVGMSLHLGVDMTGNHPVFTKFEGIDLHNNLLLV